MNVDDFILCTEKIERKILQTVIIFVKITNSSKTNQMKNERNHWFNQQRSLQRNWEE